MRTTPTRLVLLASALLSLFLLVRPAPAGAAEQQQARFTITPAAGSTTSPSGGYLVVPSTPGQRSQQAVVIENKGTNPLGLRLSPVDAATTAAGGMTYRASDSVAELDGAWLRLESTSLELPPGARQRVTIDIVVPSDARPGRHFAGVAAWSPPKTSQSATVQVTTRQVLPVVIALPGGGDPRLEVHGVQPLARPDGLRLAIEIANPSTDLIGGTGTISIDSASPKPIAFDQVVPDTSFAYQIVPDPLADGMHQVTIRLQYQDQTTDWSGTVQIGNEVRDQLTDRLPTAEITATTAPDKGRDPRALVALLAGTILLAGAAATALRRRHRDVDAT